MINEMVFFSAIIKVKKANLIQIKQLFIYKVKVIKHEKDFFYLQILEKDLKLLDELGIEYELISYKGLKYFYQKLILNISVTIGIILFLLILYINTLTIKEISFSTYTKDNEKIKAIINSNLNNNYNMKFLKTDINDINLILRKEFSRFEWISVKKDGCVLNVTILEPSIINKKIEHIDGFGDIVAKSDGLIKLFKVSHGIPVVNNNQYVRSGQLLVSGNLRINNFDESTFYIPASGEVFAEVWYTKEIAVSKIINEVEYSGNISSDKKLSLFGVDLKYKSANHNYKAYDTESIFKPLKIFKKSLPISINKIYYLEKNVIINVYDEKTSLQYAISEIRKEMNKNFRKNDKIISIELISTLEDDETYTYTFFVKTYEDIAIFQRRTINE